MSFSVKISSKDRATGRFMSRVHRALIKAVTQAKEEKKMTQAQIAEAMGVDKSVVSRIMNGEGNLTLKTIGDISWVVGLRPDFRFETVTPIADTMANSTAMAMSVLLPEQHTRMETTKPVEITSPKQTVTRTGDSNVYWQQPVRGSAHAR